MADGWGRGEGGGGNDEAPGEEGGLLLEVEGWEGARLV
jgi:hypothetical protein